MLPAAVPLHFLQNCIPFFCQSHSLFATVLARTMKSTPSWLGRAGISLPVAVVVIWLLALAAPAASNDKADFNSQIRPILSAKCFSCHGPDDRSRKAKLRLDVRDQATREHDGITAIKPGDLKRSDLVRRITTADPEDLMPPAKFGHPLTPAEIELLKRWVQQGAPYAEHWSFIKPVRPALPKVSQRAWVKNDIDRFILAKLDANKLKPSPMADRYALIRRLSLDLIGLPPTPTEVEAFVQDRSRKAYEKVVDRLLASPAYGEKWTRQWLDLARYADSYGYGQDSLRPNNPWPYRDWVIKAFNCNLPFDEFTRLQLAGDLLAQPTEEQIIATAFHRNTMTNVEGGTDDEEWRVAAVKDRANVTAQVWMGLTMGCAQCHSHKFDPISQKEYYQFYAFFNQSEDNDQPDESPTLPVPNKEQREKIAGLKSQIADLEKKRATNDPEVEREFAEWDKANQPPGVWLVAELSEFASAKGVTFQKLPDQSVLVGTNSPDKDTYTLKLQVSAAGARALRLEALTDDSLPMHGPGRSDSGNFMLNELQVTLKTSTVPKRARFVRIELPGEKRILSLAEVQVFSGAITWRCAARRRSRAWISTARRSAPLMATPTAHTSRRSPPPTRGTRRIRGGKWILAKRKRSSPWLFGTARMVRSASDWQVFICSRWTPGASRFGPRRSPSRPSPARRWCPTNARWFLSAPRLPSARAGVRSPS